MTPALLTRLQAARAEPRPVIVATNLASGAQLLMPDDDAPAALREPAARALQVDRNTTVEADGATWFLHAYNPPMRLVVVGAVHIAQALVPMASQLGYATWVTDPRRAFATDERFPGVTVSTDWPDEALDALRPDSRTAIVTLTHDPKLDDPALDRALRSDAFYIGALGSRKTHAARLDRLRAVGHGDEALGPHSRPRRARPRRRHRRRNRVERARPTRRRPPRPMIFGPVPLDEAHGAILAHTRRLPGLVLKKGSILDANGIAALRAAGHDPVIAARFEPGDVAEDEAAARLADALLTPGLTRSRAGTGRVNLVAARPGLLRASPPPGCTHSMPSMKG